MFEDEKIVDLKQELATQTENARLYRILAEGRAEKLNASHTNLDNLNKSYDELLARFDVKDEDFVRVQKRFDVEKSRADKNYEISQENRKIIVKQTSRIFELEKQVEDLKATVNALQRRNPFPHASWEAAYNVEREQKIQAYKDVEALKWENEDLKKGVYRDGGCAGCNYWETRHKKLEDKADFLENNTRIVEESNKQKDVLIEELTRQFDGTAMDLRIATNDREMWKSSYFTADKQITEWKKKHSDLMENSQVAFAQVNDLQHNVESLQKRFDIEHNALELMETARDTWRNSFGKSEDARKMLLDRVIELETEIGRLSRFEPLEQEELKELEQLRVDYENVVSKLEFSEKDRNHLIESNDVYVEDNRKLREKYDKVVEGIEKLCDDNEVRNRYE